MAGHVLAGRYALTRLIARGGMADVWEAQDTLLERQVAVKILFPHLAADADFVARFRTEAVAAARLHHRSIVAIFDTCSDNGVEAIVMELVRGHTLREEMDRHGALDPLVVINVGVDVADALQSAHQAGLIHRDVKPANILLCDDQRVMVTDFGIAKVRDTTDRTQTGTMLGSVKYLSPEQVEGDPVDPRSDVFSLGVVLYEALTGQAPFLADTQAATALARLHATPAHPTSLRPSIPRGLGDVVMRAMARHPEQRFATAAELRVALLASRTPATTGPMTTPAPRPAIDPDVTEVSARPGEANRPPTTGATSVSPQPVPAPRRRRRWGAPTAAILLIVTALIVAGVLLTRGGSSNVQTSPTTTAAGGASAQPIPLQAVAAFDPLGDNSEDDADIGAVVDGNPATFWHTEYYTDRKFSSSKTKTGVGIIVRSDQAVPLGKLTVTSPTKDWAAQVYVSDQQHAALADWGPPVAELTGIQGDATFDLGGKQGPFILLWITDLGTGPPGKGATGPSTTVVVTGMSVTPP
jgi:serine/threonine-protein kinase